MEGSLARSLYSFQSSNPDELSVPEGGIIRITQYINSHWLEAEYQGKTGFFPVTYAERLKNEPQLPNTVSPVPCLNGGGFQRSVVYGEFQKQNYPSEKQSTCSSGKSFVEAAFAFDARNESELTCPSGAVLEVTKDVDDDWLEGSFNGRTGLFPKSYVKTSERPCARAIYPFVGESVGELTFREGDCIFLRKRLNTQWMEGEIDGNVGIFPSSFVAVEVELPPDKGSFLNGDFSFMDSTLKHESRKNAATSKIRWKKGMKGKALFHFSALYSGDLELNEGDIVTVLHVDDDNWIEGQLAINGVSGSCPTAYLEPVYNTSKPFESKPWDSRTQRFDESFSGLSYLNMSNFGNTTGTSKYSSQGNFSQQSCNDLFDSYTGTESRDTCRSLLDSSFTQDPTPMLMPWMSAQGQETKTAERNEPMQKHKPAPRSKPAEKYSVTYLGSEEGKKLSTPKSYQTSVSPSLSMSSLPCGSTYTSVNSSDGMSNRKTMTAVNGVSGQSSMRGQSSSSSYFYESVGTWPRKKAGIHGRVAEEKKERENVVDVDDLLSGNCTSLPSPLIPLLQGGADDDNIESSASDDSPITPRRPAPPPPKRKSVGGNAVRSSTLPSARSNVTAQGHFNWDVLPSGQAKGQQQLDGEGRKLTVSPRLSAPVETNRVSSPSPKGSPKMRDAESAKHKPLSRPQSVHWNLDKGTGATTEKSPHELTNSNSLEQLNQTTNNNNAAIIGSDSRTLLVKHRDECSVNRGKGNSPEETDAPGLVSLQERITETEQNMKLVMTDPVKQREMEVKVSQSQQKITEWQEELKHLKDEKVFLIESHRKRMLKNKIADLEADLEKQARSQRSLEMLLGVVEENRKKEVMENLGVCAKLVEKIKNELTELEVSLHSLTEKPAESSQKHMAERRQRVVTELINTEKDYCNDLELCVKHFLFELQTTQVKDLDCEGLFSNIESVLETSQKLLKGLEDAIENKEGKDQELGKCFMDIAEEMKEVYAVYCRNHDDAISLMEKYEEMPEVQDAFTKCLDKIREHTRCWDLSSFLIKPVQRVLKYPLLLNELFKYTPEIHRDKYNLLQAISIMTDVANAINEFKRRKDLVVKYKKMEDSGLTNMIQKLSWHSVVKKSTRFNQRLTQLTGLVSQTVDEKFIEEEKKFRGIEKTVKTLWKNVSTYLEEFQETMEFRQALGENINDFYQDAATCSEVSTYYRIHKTIGQTILSRFMDSVQVQVLSPLNSLLNLFQGPQRLIQKRNDKCLDYDRWSNKIDKIKDRDKLKVAKEELELAKKNYEAMNTQLLEEIPGFTKKCMALVVDCLKNFAVAQNRLYYEIQQEYQQLLQLPVVQTAEVDIVEHHNKRSLQVMEQFSELSFIPCSFVAKDSSRKKRRSLKTPTLPSHDPDTTEDDRDIKPSLVDFKDGELVDEGGVGKTQQAPPPPSTILQPRPAPRRLNSTGRPDLKHACSPEIVDVTPGEGKLHIVEFNFEAQNAGELSVSEGDLVSVLRHSDTSGNPEWWLILCNGATGYVPQSFLCPIDDYADDGEGDTAAVGDDDDDHVDIGVEGDDDTSNGTTRDLAKNTDVKEDCSVSLTHETSSKLHYCAEFAFEANSAAELNLEEGQLVAVLQKRDLTGNDEWWLVEANGQKGYVPSSYLTLVED